MHLDFIVKGSSIFLSFFFCNIFNFLWWCIIDFSTCPLESCQFLTLKCYFDINELDAHFNSDLFLDGCVVKFGFKFQITSEYIMEVHKSYIRLDFCLSFHWRPLVVECMISYIQHMKTVQAGVWTLRCFLWQRKRRWPRSDAPRLTWKTTETLSPS